MKALELLNLIFQTTRLVVKTSGMYVRLYLARQRAVRAFKSELIKCGVNPDAAKELANLYPDLNFIS